MRRGDLDLLANPEMVLELGDRVLAVVPSEKLEEAANWFGDSERRVAQIDAFTVGLGMALGVLVGLIEVPLPGGITLKLGVAAGPLVVGMVLGWVGAPALSFGGCRTPPTQLFVSWVCCCSWRQLGWIQARHLRPQLSQPPA